MGQSESVPSRADKRSQDDSLGNFLGGCVGCVGMGKDKQPKHLARYVERVPAVFSGCDEISKYELSYSSRIKPAPEDYSIGKPLKILRVSTAATLPEQSFSRAQTSASTYRARSSVHASPPTARFESTEEDHSFSPAKTSSRNRATSNANSSPRTARFESTEEELHRVSDILNGNSVGKPLTILRVQTAETLPEQSISRTQTAASTAGARLPPWTASSVLGAHLQDDNDDPPSVYDANIPEPAPSTVQRDVNSLSEAASAADSTLERHEYATFYYVLPMLRESQLISEHQEQTIYERIVMKDWRLKPAYQQYEQERDLVALAENLKTLC
mmetsp:Transcript_22950/g.46325  ORF Transcript_22950/g.46325 Transcript_22950/m.46325 type:complete len:329 (-) Transcript_22950:90-1076(-)